MGNKFGTNLITEEQLDEYASLTYLSKAEISYLLKRFHNLGKREIHNDFHFRFHKNYIMNEFPMLKYNPLNERIFQVFSSYRDDHLSFEDMLDLCSVMSQHCPNDVKALWAFKIFDLDDDNQISSQDICNLIDKMTRDDKHNTKMIGKKDKDRICKIVLEETDLYLAGSLGPAEFAHLVSKMPELKKAFYFKI